MSIENQNAYEIMFDRMQPIIKNDIRNTDEVTLGNGCEFCLRDSVEAGDTGVIWTDSYGTDNHVCKTCNIFVEQLPLSLGIERGIVGYKLSSFKGGFIAIPKDETRPVELWIGGKYLNRVNFDGGFKIVDCTGNTAKYELCERIGEYSVVTEIGLRREMFLRHVRKSDAKNLYISTETGVINVNASEYQKLKDAFIAENLSNKELLDAIVNLNGLKTNRLNMTNLGAQALLGSLASETLEAIKEIGSPSSILFILAALRAGLVKDEVKK